MIFFDIVKVRDVEAKLVKFGFRRVAFLDHPDCNVKGAIWGHPVTKARVNLYPDGTSDRETDVLRPGWVNPAVEQAKVLAKHAERQAWENIAKLGDALFDMADGKASSETLRVMDRNLKTIHQVDKLRKKYQF